MLRHTRCWELPGGTGRVAARQLRRGDKAANWRRVGAGMVAADGAAWVFGLRPGRGPGPLIVSLRWFVLLCRLFWSFNVCQVFRLFVPFLSNVLLFSL